LQCNLALLPLPSFPTRRSSDLLHRLVKRGWLKAEWGVSEANQRAKYYRLTAAGRAQLSREQDRWSQLVDAIGRIMNPAPASEERSEEHTSELQSRVDLVCRLLL